MRDTREVPIPGGDITTIQTGTDSTPTTVMPFDCEIMGVAWWCDKTIATSSDVDHQFDVEVNDADVSIDLHIKDGVAKGIGRFDAELFCAQGDAVVLKSQDQQNTASSHWYCTYIVKPR